MPTYMLSVHTVEGEPLPSPEEMQARFEAVDVINDKLQRAGAWVFGGGLYPVDTATVVDNTRGGDVIMTDGPFAEAKEHLGGFWIINADDLDAALRWATEASAACAGAVEVRPFQDDTEDLNAQDDDANAVCTPPSASDLADLADPGTTPGMLNDR